MTWRSQFSFFGIIIFRSCIHIFSTNCSPIVCYKIYNLRDNFSLDIFYFGKINSPKTRILVQQILELASCTFFGEIKCIHFVFLRIFLGFLICLFFTNKLRQLLIPHTGLVAEEWNQEESRENLQSLLMRKKIWLLQNDHLVIN